MTNFVYLIIGTGRLMQSRRHVWLTMPISSILCPIFSKYSPNNHRTFTKYPPNIPYIFPPESPCQSAVTRVGVCPALCALGRVAC